MIFLPFEKAQLLDMKATFKTLLVTLFICITQLASGHAPDQSYLYLRIYGDNVGGRVEMTAKDMNRAMGLNLPDRMTMEMVQPHIEQIYAYILAGVSFANEAGSESYPINFTEPSVLNLEEMEDFVRFNFELTDMKKVPDVMDIKYNLVFDSVQNHKGVCLIEYNWKDGNVDEAAQITNIFTGNDNQQTLDLSSDSVWKGFWALVKLGMYHIWIGLDHILFILALILPAVMYRRKDEETLAITNDWVPHPKFKPAFFYIIKIVTFFTIAHSITLALASLNIINLPSRIVESIIAISIALAAWHNIVPIFKAKEWLIAFLFGLFHGFGFASVLGDKGLNGDFLVYSLLGFNVGVELGQLAIILAIFPVLFLLRKTKIYPPLLKWGSVLLILISIYWFIERAFEVDLPAGAILSKLTGGLL